MTIDELELAHERMCPVRRSTCRTCPAILENYVSDQCVRCEERSRAVRAAVAEADPIPVLRVPKRARKVGACDHHGCEHFEAVLRAVTRQVGDLEFCLVCSSDVVVDDELVHETRCALGALENRA